MKSLLAMIALAIAVAGCDAPAPTATPEVADDALTSTAELGPVRATLELRPKEPRLGDVLTLSLVVTAEAGIEVTMPDFGEALGRFSIVSFEPRERHQAGQTVHEQVYGLQPPMSGPQRIPPLRVEFVDKRKRAGKKQLESRELLTDELAVNVASVLPEGEVTSELRAARDSLGPRNQTLLLRFWWAFLAAGVVLGGAVMALLRWRSSRAQIAKVDAYQAAMQRLAVLEARGLPTGETADAWYVELSSIVRRYLEDRYRVRAPELTTEEFLLEAQRSRELTGEHRALLASFLTICDRVKFAGHEPNESESSEALTAARRFLSETRATAAQEAA